MKAVQTGPADMLSCCPKPRFFTNAITHSRKLTEPVDLKHLQEFMYLSRDLSFTKTAERCYVSQSVLSRHIQNLEAKLGCELLIRDKNGIRLTPYGESFAESCKRIDDEYNKALLKLASIEGDFEEVLRVSYVSLLPPGFIDEAYEVQLKRYPQVRLNLMSSWEERAIMLMRQDKVSMTIAAVFDEPDPRIYSTLPLFEDHYVLLMPDEHPLAAQDDVDLNDLAEETLLIPAAHDFPIQNAKIAQATDHLSSVRLRATINSKHDAVALANARRGISLISNRTIQGMDLRGLKPIPLICESLAFDIRAVWKKDNDLPPLKGFIGILRELRDSGRFA